MKKTQILLSTYNGEKHLREQLDSFINLNNFKDIKVLIRDDGSNDGTIAILKEYEEKYNFEIILGKNVGLAKSMFELMARCDMECEYFSFSDQDDVWLPNKLERAVKSLEKENPQKPVLYGCRSSLTDEKLNIFGNTATPKREISFYNAMIQNVIPGHTQVCNRTLINLIRTRYSDKIYMIDLWFYMVASSVGKIVFDTECTTLYRQHKNNTLGYETNFIKKNIQRLKRLHKKETHKNIVMLYDMCNKYSDIMPAEHVEELKKFFSMQHSFINRLRYIITTKAYRQSGYENIIFRVMYLLGKYNLEQ